MEFVEDTKGKIRSLPIDLKLRKILIKAAKHAGIEKVRVTSGGQCAKGTCTKRTGSTRHDLGKAADLEIWKNNRPLAFDKTQDLPYFKKFVMYAAELGATGFGAGLAYMGKQTIHVGFGSKAIWGDGGKTSNAPMWLKDAVIKGWHSQGSKQLREYLVIARDGLILRAGPGTEFERLQSLTVGSIIYVENFFGKNADWAAVDLDGDGYLDGYVHRAFISENK